MVMIYNDKKKLALLSSIILMVMMTAHVNSLTLVAEAKPCEVQSGGDSLLITPKQDLCLPGQAKNPLCVPQKPNCGNDDNQDPQQ